jgi:hypothetical protein
MDKKRFKEIIARLNSIDLNDDFTHEKCWKEEIEVLREDVNGTIEYLNSECTEDEFTWISEIIEDLIDATKSKELLECYKSLAVKYPEASATYNIDDFIESAEAILT